MEMHTITADEMPRHNMGNPEVYDEDMSPVKNPDLTLGYLYPSERIVHHDAVEAVAAMTELRVKKVYPNGTREMEEVVVVPGVEGKPAYDEKIPIHIYHRRTEAEQKAYLEALNRPADRELIERLTSRQEDTELLLADWIGGAV